MAACARVAAPAVYTVSPLLGHYTDSLLFGSIWPDPTISPRDRSLLTISALISTGKAAQLGNHARRALVNGLTPQQIGGVIAHLAFYTGWPNAMSAVQEVVTAFAERGIQPLEVPATSSGEAVDFQAAVHRNLAEASDQFINKDLWQRVDLCQRDRALVSIVALIALREFAELRKYTEVALSSDLTSTELHVALIHLSFYLGFPRVKSAAALLDDLLTSVRTEGS